MAYNTVPVEAVTRLTHDTEFSVKGAGRFKFRSLRHEKSGDVIITGVGGRSGHSEFRSFKVAGPSPLPPAKFQLHRKSKLR